jgi:hypothetical protein
VDNNTVTFTPALNQNGSASITYTVEQDGGGEMDTGTIWLHVYPVNDLPEIDSAPESITVDEDTSGGFTFNVTFHDADCDTDDLYFYVLYAKQRNVGAPIPFQAWYTVTRTDTTGVSVTLFTARKMSMAPVQSSSAA